MRLALAVRRHGFSGWSGSGDALLVGTCGRAMRRSTFAVQVDEHANVARRLPCDLLGNKKKPAKPGVLSRKSVSHKV